MRYDSRIHHRRSIRLKGYDYSTAGAYFITICIQDRLSLLGDIVDGRMILNDAGRMVERVWRNLPKYYPGMEPDTFILMPNHFHGNLFLTRRNLIKPAKDKRILTLAEVVQRFKTMTTRYYIDGVEKSGWTQFRRRLWLRNYYEHVIRSDEELDRIRQYIEENPMRWEEDDNNPDRL